MFPRLSNGVRFKFLMLCCLIAVLPVLSQESVLHDALVIRAVGRAGRALLHTDAVEAQIVNGHWHSPRLGESISLPDGKEVVWEAASGAADGWFEGGATRGGYVYWPFVSAKDQVMLLEAAGHNLVYVNGEIRAGDPYAYGYVHLPVRLHAGTNELLFYCARGRFRASLVPPSGPLLIETNDATLPDLVLGDDHAVWGATVLLNPTAYPVTAILRTRGARSWEGTVTIPPLGLRKAAFRFYPPSIREMTNCPLELEATVRVPNAGPSVRAQLYLRIRRPEQTYKTTFESSIDDSVQYYAVNPSPSANSNASSALFLSVHGASVEALGQADAYSPKKWGILVCPTNRRPYGFDWEEWGRMDAMEVLGLAEARFHPDPARIYLTGHSMGGHGAWQLGALYPDHFAATGPSAGWISFTSYVSTNLTAATNAMQKMMLRAAATSDTLLMATNYLQEGVYIIHGAEDDNVPVTEARHMRDVLSTFHHDFVYHEQPGAGHWWDVSDEPGADCVDWAPLFDFFAHHALPADESLRRIQFVTLNPAVSSRCHWVTVLSQEHSLEPSRIDVRCDPGKRRLVGSAENISRLMFELPMLKPGAPFSIELNGQVLQNVTWPTSPKVGAPVVYLTLQANRWTLAELPAPNLKNPSRSGPFRLAFCNHMVFVYGTHGNAAENAWSLARARYDAESFYYRGNGSVPLLTDTDYATEFQAGNYHADTRNRNVVLYGNADSNSAWKLLLAASPVQVHRGSVRIGERELTGDNVACLFLQPLPNAPTALVGVVSGSGLAGLRLTERLPYFLSGAGFPDCLVIDSKMLTEGITGIRAAGFFGEDWSAANGEFAWAQD